MISKHCEQIYLVKNNTMYILIIYCLIYIFFVGFEYLINRHRTINQKANLCLFLLQASKAEESKIKMQETNKSFSSIAE